MDGRDRALALEPHCDDPLTLSRNVVQIMGEKASVDT